MMKRFFILLSALIMCVGLCACGDGLTDEQTAAVCGNWHLRAYEEKADNPGYFELKSDGTGSFNGTEQLTWTTLADSGKDVGMTLTAVTETEREFALSLSNDQTEMWLTMADDGPEYCYQRTDTAVPASWFGDLLTRWYAREGNSAIRSVELMENGAAKINDTACFWTNGADWTDDENSVHLYLYDGQGVFGVVEVGSYGNGLYDFTFYDYATHRSESYCHHPMADFLQTGSWESFDRHTMIDDCVIFGEDSVAAEIAGVEYGIWFDTASDPQTVTVQFLQGDEIRYTALVAMDGEYPMLTLTDRETEQQTLYYSSEFGYDPENKDALYYGCLDLIYRYASGDRLYASETDEEMDRENCLSYIYEKLTALGDHRQTKDFLSRFTVVPDKLTGVTQFCTDYQGDVHEIALNRYGYDMDGRLIWGQGEDIIEKYGVNSAAVQYFAYDSRGKIAGIQTDDGQTSGTPIFDGAGKLVGMHVLGRDTEYTTVYTYGKGHRVIRMGVSKTESYYPLVYEYEYDDAGRLTTKIMNQGNSFAATSTYTYKDDVLEKIVQVCWKDGMSYTNTYYFTNDEKGRPLSAELTTSNPDMEYESLEIRYIYEDLYFLDTAGLKQGE